MGQERLTLSRNELKRVKVLGAAIIGKHDISGRWEDEELDISSSSIGADMRLIFRKVCSRADRFAGERKFLAQSNLLPKAGYAGIQIFVFLLLNCICKVVRRRIFCDDTL
jgi:hypothetical protein